MKPNVLPNPWHILHLLWVYFTLLGTALVFGAIAGLVARRIWFAAFLLLVTPVMGQEIEVVAPAEIPLVAVDTKSREIFVLGHRGCLRGPLYIKNDEGKKIFELADGAYYPLGCNRKEPQ